MSKTTIEWTQRPGTIGEVWNTTTGCNKVDRGCKYCYAELMHGRLQAMGQRKYAANFLDGAVEHEDMLALPFSWGKPRTVFVDSMSDLFHVNVTFEFLERVFKVMAKTPQHTYLILTKRPQLALLFWEHMRKKRGRKFRPTDNVWIGTSANDHVSAEKRVPLLLELDVAVRFLSYEPATGPLQLRHLDADMQGHKEYCMVDALTGEHTDMARPCAEVNKLDWVIAGGESGPHAEPAHPDWFRKVREDCQATGVPFFFKQWGQWQPAGKKTHQNPISDFKTGRAFMFAEPHTPQLMHRVAQKSGNLLDGKLHLEFPHPKLQAHD